MEFKANTTRVINHNIQRGEIYYADLSGGIGCEQGGVRPVLIIQNNIGNRFSPTVIAAAITSQQTKSKIPTHIFLDSEKTKMEKDSIVLLEQIRTIDKSRLREKVTYLDDIFMSQVDQALSISFGMNQEQDNQNKRVM